MNTRMQLYALGIASAIIVAASGCALRERTVQDIPRTFLEDVDIHSKRENLPFDHAWLAPGMTKERYQTVMFRPVRTDLLPLDQWERSASAFIVTREDYLAKSQEVAQHFNEQIVQKMGEEGLDGGGLRLTNRPGPDTIVIEIALTELEFSHPVARAASLAAPVPGTGAAIASITDPHVAFAARLKDGGTGKLIATIGDRKFAPTRIVDLNKLTVSSSAREVVSLWAEEFAQGLGTKQQITIDEKRFSILPW
jgi:hypothetical protein